MRQARRKPDRRRRPLPLIALLVALPPLGLATGCRAPVDPGGDTPPEPPVWYRGSCPPAEDPAWWSRFGDPALPDLVAEAFRANPNLERAREEIAAARAGRRRAGADALPRLGAELGWREARERTFRTGFQADDLAPWTGGAELAWELDLTGRRRALTRAAGAREASAYARWVGLRLLLATEVAAARFEAYDLGREAALVEELLAVNRDLTRLLQSRVDGGLASDTEVSRQRAEALALEREAAEIERRRGLVRIRLLALLGRQPGDPHAPALDARPAAPGAGPSPPPLPRSLPAENLSSRPDILAAEADLRAAWAVADAARLDLLPTLELSAGAGFINRNLTGDFLRWMAEAGPALTLPLWDPRRRAELERARASARAAEADFRARTLDAYREITSAALSRSAREQLHALALQEADERRQVWEISRQQFEAGLVPQVDSLTVQRTYIQARRAAIGLHLATLQDHLQLVLATGGG